MSKLLLVAVLFAVAVSAAKNPSCKKACGNAISIKGEIACYCHSMCILEQPGKCCDDFQDKCPDEFAEGMELLAQEQALESTVQEGQATMPTLPEGCEFPEGNIIPVPENQYDWYEAGQTCENKCGSSMVETVTGEDGEAKEEVVCFCDSGCLLTADCCPDFPDFCEVDPCIIAMMMPNAAAQQADIGTCKNHCDEIVPATTQYGYCSCEAACVETSSCCLDFPEMCPDLVDETLIPQLPEAKDGSCHEKCGGGSGDCWCDYQCAVNGDCCDDYEASCGAPFSLISWVGHGSCHNKCGGAGFDCWCDDKCLTAGDCCSDYLQKCQEDA